MATHILAWEGDDEDPAKWFWFEGNFASYEENKVERLGSRRRGRTGSPTAASPATDPRVAGRAQPRMVAAVIGVLQGPLPVPSWARPKSSTTLLKARPIASRSSSTMSISASRTDATW